MVERFTPDEILTLSPGEIFVFGSNAEGRHGGGAAAFADRFFGAVWGQGEGLQGQSYAIPTMGAHEDTAAAVDRFLGFAAEHEDLTFLVTKIGTGIAGWPLVSMAALFARRLPNVILPAEFVASINTNQVRPLSWGRGDWMQTFTGRKFFPMDPRSDDVDPADIAHALSLQCRYNGHVDRFYSVAEHCVLLSRVVSPENAAWALLHDATEAYVGDMIRPLKRSMPDYCEAEDRVMVAIADAFGLSGQVIPDEVKEADTRILLDERAALMSLTQHRWAIEDLEPLAVTIYAWSPEEAERQYLDRLRELGLVALHD